MFSYVISLFSFLFFTLINTVEAEENQKTIIRVGHFPNITHAQPMIAHQLTRQQKGWFEKAMGPNFEVQWYVYNAGPTAMEAIFADSIDMTYVGPTPTINAFIKSKGNEMRIICGSCSGGAALLVQSNEAIKTDADFKGKKIATPQLGNTQDVAARAWFKSKGYNIHMGGGDLFVIPTNPSDQVILFQKGDIDGAWTIEPWVSILKLSANASVYLDESSLWPETNGKYVTTHLVSSKKFMDAHPDIIKKWVQAHVELTEWINSNPREAKELFSKELEKITNVPVKTMVLDNAWKNIELTYDPIKTSLFKDAENIYNVGFLKKKPDLTGIYDLRALNQILKEKGKAEIPNE